MHGTMDDQTIRQLAERLAYLRGLDERRAEVREAIEAQGKLTDALESAIAGAETLAALDDLYRPYRPKRRTRASIAREKGLEPLAAAITAARTPSPTLETLAAPFIALDKGVETVSDALAGAGDIIAEDLSDDANLRGRLRALLHRTASSAQPARMRRTRPMPCTTTFPSRCAACRATACSPSTAAKKRASSR